MARSCNVTSFMLCTLLASTALAQEMPTAPAVTLPEVQVPTVITPPAAEPSANVEQKANTSLLPAVPDANVPAQPVEPAIVDLKAPFSYGKDSYSLMFSPAQVKSMQRALSTYEMLKRTGQVNPDIQIIEEQADPTKAAPSEPKQYPVYTLSSIVFHTAKDWTVWLGPLRITPKTNDQEVRVIGISAARAQFAWKPAYSAALRDRVQNNQLADSAPVAHKMTKPNGALFDQQSGQVVFSLRPNQTFAPAYMATFEGRVAPVAMPEIVSDKPEDAPLESTPAADGAGDNASTNPVLQEDGIGSEEIRKLYDQAGGSAVGSTRSTLEKLQESQKNLQNIVPQKVQPQPTTTP